jgi:BirA family biotin operon repressor/biotin-[acetyl-CoA-carboxylase] ligase
MNLVAAWYELERVDSTNDHALRLIRDGHPRQCFCVLAREQSAGRGSRGRGWCSPRDAGLYMTLAAPVATSPAGAALTSDWTIAAGAACVDVLRALTSLPVRLCGVNDITLHGGKLGGILTEALVEGSQLSWLITGVGLNLHRARRTLQPEAPPAVALQQYLPSTPRGRLGAGPLAERLAAAILQWHGRLLADRAAAARAAAGRRRCAVPAAALAPVEVRNSHRSCR